MSRPKGSSNRETATGPDSISYTTEQRLEFIANLIVDSITQDEANGGELLHRIGGMVDGIV